MSQGFKLPLPDNVLKLLDESSRKALGKYGTTMAEIEREQEVKSERELHEQVANLLRLKGIEFIHSRTDRKTTNQVGTPDFLMGVWVRLAPTKADPTATAHLHCIPVAFELKLPGKKLDPEQLKMFEHLTTSPNAWTVRVIHSLEEAVAELKKLGL